MEFTLKKVKMNETMSEETPCFSADLYVKNKLVAHISNTGQGGSNSVHPAKGLKYSDVAKFDNLDVECEIFDKVEEISIVKKKQGKAIVLKRDGDLFFMGLAKSLSVYKKLPQYGGWLQAKRLELESQGYTILNTNL